MSERRGRGRRRNGLLAEEGVGWLVSSEDPGITTAASAEFYLWKGPTPGLFTELAPTVPPSPVARYLHFPASRVEASGVRCPCSVFYSLDSSSTRLLHPRRTTGDQDRSSTGRLVLPASSRQTPEPAHSEHRRLHLPLPAGGTAFPRSHRARIPLDRWLLFRCRSSCGPYVVSRTYLKVKFSGGSHSF